MKTKLSLSLTLRKAALGLMSLLLTAASYAQALTYVDDRGFAKDAGITEVLNLLDQSQSPNEVTQIIESSTVPALYKITDLRYADDYEKITMPLSTWRKLAQYFAYTGYQARLIHSINGPRSLAAFYVTDLVDCVTKRYECRVKFGDDIEMNWGYMFGLINKKTIPAEVLFQEATGFVNSQLLLANSDFCKLMEQGLTLPEINKFYEAIGFLESVMPYTLANQRPSAARIVQEVQKCKPAVSYEPDRFYRHEYLQKVKCQEQGNRIVCKELGQR
ncbi:hypothetical protein [Bdellovibrio sp. HCB2-146]|uniref:hypothetical protein n=1 Tax=Bdellovibrio sp. HCB2-146 TaxID=3394362 RepID=UPI0039BCD533